MRHSLWEVYIALMTKRKKRGKDSLALGVASSPSSLASSSGLERIFLERRNQDVVEGLTDQEEHPKEGIVAGKSFGSPKERESKIGRNQHLFPCARLVDSIQKQGYARCALTIASSRDFMPCFSGLWIGNATPFYPTQVTPKLVNNAHNKALAMEHMEFTQPQQPCIRAKKRRLPWPLGHWPDSRSEQPSTQTSPSQYRLVLCASIFLAMRWMGYVYTIADNLRIFLLGGGLCMTTELWLAWDLVPESNIPHRKLPIMTPGFHACMKPYV
ncbi:hypothetical protein VNO77_23175 [Canavalia gladiata]|uniref:Uncharacterized protein n=1 Tax=Canavalia gladiata TaxID=3824 RepID=A0AAN9Q8P0_CANGL